MLEKLFESLDDKVFTAELKESLQAQFNEAVETQASIVAEERIEEQIDSLNEKAEEHIEFLNEKAEEYVAIKEAEMLDNVDKYLNRVVEEFVSEAKESLAESVKNEKADMIIEAFDSMLVATGVKVSQIVEAKEDSSVESKLDEAVSKYDALVEENIALEKENEELLKTGTITEMCEGLSMVEAEKFKKLAGLVEFTKDQTFVDKLDTIKESIKGSVEDREEVSEAVNETVEADKPAWSHLV